MVKKVMLSCLVFFVVTGNVFSQQKANFRMAEKFASDRLQKMAGTTSVRPVWLHKSNKFWYSDKTGNGTNYYLVDPAKKSKQALFDNLHMATELTKLAEKPINERALLIKNIKFKKTNDSFTFQVDSVRFKYVLITRRITLIDTLRKKEEEKKLINKRWASFSPDSIWVTYAKNHNLFIMR